MRASTGILAATGVLPEAFFLEGRNSNSNNSTVNFTGVDFGEPVSSRRILVAAAGRKSSGNPSLAVAVGGESATQIAFASRTDIPISAGLFLAPPSVFGATGTVAVTLGGFDDARRAIGVYYLRGFKSYTPADVHQMDAFNDVRGSLSVLADGYAFSVVTRSSNVNFTLLGVDLDFNSNADSFPNWRARLGHALFGSDQNVTVGANDSAIGARFAAAAASFR